MYGRDQIEEVRSKIDIVSVIREYVPSLTTAGRTVRGLCPFHQEKTPSFHVQPEKGFFKCFGCGEAGDVISFVSKMEHVGFSDALEKLAGQAGVVLKNINQPLSEAPKDDTREKLFRVLEEASRAYQDRLWDNRLGEGVREYLTERGITEETAQNFELGYSPPTGETIFEGLIKKGSSFEHCQKAGLVARSQAGRFYDPQRGRLIFPIRDSFGHVVGFGGRLLPENKKRLWTKTDDDGEGEGPKYLNSPETPVFSKGKLLYGLHQGKGSILENRRAMIMEGYMDVIGAHQGGFKTAVATLGTAFTRDHAKLLKRYADEAIAFFDADEAGQRAAVKSIGPMLQESIFPRVVVPETDLDPDEIILKQGKDAFQGILDKAPDFADYLLMVGLAGGEPTLIKKSALAQQILEIIRESPNEILKSEWVAKTALRLGLAKDSLEKELSKEKRVFMSGGERAPEPVGRTAKRGFSSAEEEFLQLYSSTSGGDAEPGLTEEDFKDERLKRLFAMIKAQKNEKGSVSVPQLLEEVPAEDRDWVTRLFMEEIVFTEPATRREELIRDIRAKRERERWTELGEKIKRGAGSKDDTDEYGRLLKKLKGSS